MPDDADLGLRERKKLDTRRALSDAALELTFERGLDEVVREDIAARAGVSVRTFANYFANKYEALAWRQIERIHRTTALLAARPAGEPMWDAVTAAALEPFEAEGATGFRPSREQLVEVRKLVEAPETRGAITRATYDGLAAAVAARSHTDPDRDLYPRLMAGTIVSAYYVATEIYVRSDPPESITTVLRQTFSALAAGLPEPGR
ncbi:TetR/AcrR family transcriptional regulator [Nocardia sp. BMG51109]|uniref:TetR/AcrR family transcriptional regulator n=1 Tax=Nocardia sp. BMG51109 TaxID=1056816 RepID=UPI00046420FB|nr:TetR family transcriptional regulator [Nocardia sp. BMG51109]